MQTVKQSNAFAYIYHVRIPNGSNANQIEQILSPITRYFAGFFLFLTFE